MTNDKRDGDRFVNEPESEVYWYPLFFDPEDEEVPTSIEPLPWFLNPNAEAREPATAGSK